MWFAIVWDAFAVVGIVGTAFSFSIAAVFLVMAART